MKLLRILFITGLICFSSHILVSCKTKSLSKESSYSRGPEPNDYWTLKRSHPVYGFDKKAYMKGMEAVQEIKNQNQTKDGPLLNLNWQLEGPNNIGGRVNVVTPLTRTSDTIFSGTANGGIFRTYDGGISWTPIFQEFSYLAIGAITVDPSNTNIIYCGTGDRNYGGYSYNGNGLYKSTDLGNTWVNIGLTDVGIITSCIVHSANPNNILVGVLGSGFEKSLERGVFRSTDGGSTWTNTLFVSDSSGVSEMRADPTNPDIIYATTFNRLNLPDRGISTGTDSKIFKSINGGATWTQLTNGLPAQELSRVGIAISETNPNKLYALYVGDDYQVYEVYISSDAGASWTALNVQTSNLDPSALGGFGWYFGRIHVNPFNENHIVVPGVEQFESFDGGINWSANVPPWWTYEVHADKHDLYWKNANTMIIGTDGGMYKTTNGGNNWTVLGELPITQFYRVNANPFEANQYAGGAQDNGTTSGNATVPEWSRDFGGDGFQSYYLDENAHSTTFETQRGGIYWYDDITGTTPISPNLDFPLDRTNWSTPYFVYDNGELTAGTYRVLTYSGAPFGNWSALTTDLTMIGQGATTPERYHTITELNYNSFNENEVLVGTSDGLVWKGNRNNGASFVNIKSNLPDKFVSSVTYSKKTNGKIYVTMTGYYNNFYQALVFKSEDGGANWQSISSNLPAIGVNDLITKFAGGEEALIIATDGGVFISQNDGVSWEMLGNNLPVITISALDINENNNRLIAGTFGRSMWSYDLTWYLGLEEKNLDNQVIYPNPVKDILYIEKAVQLLEIYTVNGRKVKSFENVAANGSVDLSDLEKGVYILRTENSVIKFIKY